jgi:regulator of protease activity HflC (stomatin/prohibitin superfamily)
MNQYNYGVKIRSVSIKEITPPPEYQEAATLKYKADREAQRMKAVYGAAKGLKGILFKVIELLRGK